MILTCPKCATRFFADDQAIGPSGRRVKCDACGEVWLSARVENTVEVPSNAALAPEAATVAESAAATDAPLFVERPSPAQRPVRRPSRTPWVIGLVIAALLIVCLVVFRQQIERMFPGASTAYEALGLGKVGRADR